MAAYASHQRKQLTRLLRSEPSKLRTSPFTSSARAVGAGPDQSIGVEYSETDQASLINELLDQLVDRVAVAVVARIASGHMGDQDEWLDSRQAAEYLGLHRDTLRRLAAARAIPAEQDGRGCKLFFRRGALDAWRRSGGQGRHLSSVADAA